MPILLVILSDTERSKGESKDLQFVQAKEWETANPNVRNHSVGEPDTPRPRPSTSIEGRTGGATKSAGSGAYLAALPQAACQGCKPRAKQKQAGGFRRSDLHVVKQSADIAIRTRGVQIIEL